MALPYRLLNITGRPAVRNQVAAGVGTGSSRPQKRASNRDHWISGIIRIVILILIVIIIGIGIGAGGIM